VYTVHCLLIMSPHSSEGLHGGTNLWWRDGASPYVPSSYVLLGSCVVPWTCVGLGKRRMGYKGMTRRERGNTFLRVAVVIIRCMYAVQGGDLGIMN
jgi:hypothetical protein